MPKDLIMLISSYFWNRKCNVWTSLLCPKIATKIGLWKISRFYEDEQFITRRFCGFQLCGLSFRPEDVQGNLHRTWFRKNPFIQWWLGDSSIPRGGMKFQSFLVPGWSNGWPESCWSNTPGDKALMRRKWRWRLGGRKNTPTKIANIFGIQIFKRFK